MNNQAACSPTRRDKILERLQQERERPRATFTGRHGAERSQGRLTSDASVSTHGGDVTTSNDKASRRGDAAAGESTTSLPLPR